MLKQYDAFIVDLDGCMYRGDVLVPGSPEVVSRLRRLGKKLLFLTNNATKTPEDFAAKLTGMGVKTRPEEVLTSAAATATYLLKNFGAARILPVGGKALVKELRRAGHRVLAPRSRRSVDFVVAGLDFNFTYAKLNLAAQAILSGAKFVATNMDPTLPVEGGLMPGAGSIVKAISVAANVKPILIGKPSKRIIDVALERLDVEACKAVLVGDRLDTDIQAGNRVGAFTILVLSGSTRMEEVEKASPSRRPSLTLPDVSHMLKYLD